MTSAITATGLRKSFGGTAVLEGIDLEVGAGTTFSLLGPNGVGKITTVQIISTRVHADGGETRVAGQDVAAGSAGGTGPDGGHRPVLRGRQPAHRRREPAAVNAWPVRAATASQRSDRAGRLADCRCGQRRDLHRLRQVPDRRDRGRCRGQESSNGTISVGRAGAGVDAKTPNGSIRLGEVACGSIVAGIPAGDLEIGIVEGIAARLAVTINRSRPAIAATGLRRLGGPIERAGGEDTGSERAFR